MRAYRFPRPPGLRRLVRNAVIVLVLGLVGIGVAAILSGRYQVRPVLSGSMRPGLPVGGIVITKQVPISSLQVRDVVVFHRPDYPQELVVHRIISLTHGPGGIVIQTQGDANNAPDPWKVTLRGTTAYRAVYSLPMVGYIAVWMHNPSGRRTLLGIGLLLVAGAATGSILSRRRKASAIDADSDDAANMTDEILDDAAGVQSEAEPAPATV
jgi:signal peptidase I